MCIDATLVEAKAALTVVVHDYVRRKPWISFELLYHLFHLVNLLRLVVTKHTDTSSRKTDVINEYIVTVGGS